MSVVSINNMAFTVPAKNGFLLRHLFLHDKATDISVNMEINHTMSQAFIQRGRSLILLRTPMCVFIANVFHTSDGRHILCGSGWKDCYTKLNLAKCGYIYLESPKPGELNLLPLEPTGAPVTYCRCIWPQRRCCLAKLDDSAEERTIFPYTAFVGERVRFGNSINLKTGKGQWKVDVKFLSGRPFAVEGWRWYDVFSHLRLQEGQHVLFKYEGGDDFSLFVFSSDGVHLPQFIPTDELEEG